EPDRHAVRQIIELVCCSHYCLLILLKRFFKAVGEAESSKYIGSMLRLRGFGLSPSAPSNALDTIFQNNVLLEKKLDGFLRSRDSLSRRDALLALNTEASVPKASAPAFAELLASLLHENSKALPSSQSVLSQSGQRESRVNTETSLFCDEEDPYFILQPLR